MVAVDTNVLVRLITQDDAAQVARAARLFQREQVWIAKTVLLETAWVLKRLYGFTPQETTDALQALAGLSAVHLEDPLAVNQALSWLDAGVDFADGLNLASCGKAARFASFDARLLKSAAKLGCATFPL
jgi:predicted nucleic-acid-binding protein